MPIRIRLALSVSLILLILISLSYYGSDKQSQLHNRLYDIQKNAADLIHLTEQVDNNFQKQLLSWTNLLLRGQVPSDYHFYLKKFYQQERTTRNEIKSLSKKLNEYTEAKKSTIKFIEAHDILGVNFRRALKIFNQSISPAYDADQFIWDSFSLPIELLSEIKDNILLHQTKLINETEKNYELQNKILIIAYIIIILSFLFLFLWFLDTNIGKPLSTTTNIAKNIAQGDYSQRVYERFPGEFNLFAIAFNNMMEHISKTNNDLLSNMTTLQEEIDTRTKLEKQLKHKKLLAEDASKAKSEFLSTMSHEIRTPLNVVTGYIELLQLTELSDQQKEYIQTIQAGSESLLSVINDILDYAKIESGKLNIEFNPLSLQELVHDISHMFDLSIQEKNLKFNITIKPDVPDNIISDFNRLKQILVNLISNAIKFTDSGYISLTIDTIPSENTARTNLSFKVEDSGIGINKEFLKKIFNHFEQQSSQDSRKYGGTGLGLAICKKLSLLLNGDLSVTSTVNRGSEFTLNLNDIEISGDSVKSSNTKLPTIIFKPATILVTDDMKANRNLIKNLLRGQPINFLEATNGLEAIKLAKDNQIDLILMDIKMPEMDGIEATTILREDKELKDTPILALSASSIHEDDTELKQSLFNEYLTKPLKLQILCERLKNYLETE